MIGAGFRPSTVKPWGYGHGSKAKAVRCQKTSDSIQTKIGSKMGGEFTYQNGTIGFDDHSHMLQRPKWKNLKPFWPCPELSPCIYMKSLGPANNPDLTASHPQFVYTTPKWVLSLTARATYRDPTRSDKPRCYHCEAQPLILGIDATDLRLAPFFRAQFFVVSDSSGEDGPFFQRLSALVWGF